MCKNQIRVQHIDYTEATGPCWARHMAQKLYCGEKYYFSIDSHTRFIKNWDEILINLLKKCPSQKSILTTYPPGYHLPNELSKETRPVLTCAKELGNDGMLRFVGKLLNQNFEVPISSFFWVSGFSFSLATMIEEVPYDPHLPHLFFGEESSMTVRLWTKGWDFYAPGRNIIYHLWERDHRPNFRELKDINKLEQISLKRVKFILGILDKDQLEEEALVEMDKYGIGDVRTIQQFQEHTGVNFREGKLSSKAFYCGHKKEIFMDELFNKIADLVNLINPTSNPLNNL